MPQPSFDKWTSLFLMVASAGFFISLLLLTHQKGNKKANRILGTLILLFSVNLLLFSFYWAGYKGVWDQLLLVALCFYFLFGPLLLWYWHCFNHLPFRYKTLHALPFILNVLYIFPVALNSTHLLPFVYRSSGTVNFVINNVFNIGYGISAFLYSLHFLQLVNRTKKAGKNSSQPEKLKQKWLFQLSTYYWVFSFSLILYTILVKFSLMQVQYDYIISFTASVFIYLTGIKGFRQPELFNYEYANGRKQGNGKYEKSSLKKGTSETIIAALQHFMDSKKVYLDSELTLQSLAAMMHCSTHHLSQVINEQFGITYPEYINRHRIEAARHILADPKFHEEKILGVAFEVGYNNKTTFNMVFKRITGFTPSEYRKISIKNNLPPELTGTSSI
jgi:AraC-like DNA-binding protein